MTRLEYVQEELCGAIEEQLDDDDAFNIVVFSTGVQTWKRELTRASSRNKRQAIRFVRALRPDGETNIYGALEATFNIEDVDTVYFLSDGFPTAGPVTVGEEILGDVRKWNTGRGVQIHAVAFLAGDAEQFGVIENRGMSERFLRALAEENDGTFHLFE